MPRNNNKVDVIANPPITLIAMVKFILAPIF
jgi:hypothetical protein